MLVIIYSTRVISASQPAQPCVARLVTRSFESCSMPNGSPNDTNNSPWWIRREDGTDSFTDCRGVSLCGAPLWRKPGTYAQCESDAAGERVPDN